MGDLVQTIQAQILALSLTNFMTFLYPVLHLTPSLLGSLLALPVVLPLLTRENVASHSPRPNRYANTTKVI